MPAETAEARSIQEIEKEKSTLQNRSGQLNTEIKSREKNMSALESERAKLEDEVVQTQMKIDDLKEKIHDQEETLKMLEAEIEKLQEEIEYLKEQIALREEKLENQARAIQTQGNTTNMVDIIVSAENLSDLIGRIGVVSQLVGANKDIVDAQIADQEELERKEAEVQEDKEAAEAVKKELENNRNELESQKKELDNKIIRVAELYQMNASEKEKFVKEQQVVAQKTSTLNREISAEKQRIAAEQAKQEAARKAAAAAAKKQTVAASTSSSSASSKAYASGMIRPVNGGYLTSRYGYRVHPIFGTRRLHAGTDIGGGGPIKAAKAGTVIRAGYGGGWGYYVKIDHGNGVATLYGHMQPNLLVSVGQHVAQGQQIGTMGSTGNSTGVHLHFEVYINGSTVDSAPYIGF